MISGEPVVTLDQKSCSISRQILARLNKLPITSKLTQSVANTCTRAAKYCRKDTHFLANISAVERSKNVKFRLSKLRSSFYPSVAFLHDLPPFPTRDHPVFKLMVIQMGSFQANYSS